MIPLTFWERIKALWAPWRWVQCCAKDKPQPPCCYCVRAFGHFGKHRTYHGVEFADTAGGNDGK